MTLPMRSLSVERHPPPWVRRALPLLVRAVIGVMSEAQEVANSYPNPKATSLAFAFDFYRIARSSAN